MSVVVVIRDAIIRAFQMWSDVTPLTFSEVEWEEDGDFKLEFVAGEHRDGPQNAFDGQGIPHAVTSPTGQLGRQRRKVENDTVMGNAVIPW